MFKRPDAEIHYEVHGAGFPVLLYAPGGLRSQVELWGGASPAYPKGFPWMDPRTALADKYTVIAMDQRNAGKSVADVKPDHGWHTFAADHLALMDHLGFGKFHVMGGCIGGSYCFEAIEQAPGRIAAAVLQNPIGLWENRDTWDAAVKGYGETVRARDPSISQETIDSLRPEHVRPRLRVLGHARLREGLQDAALPSARHRQAASRPRPARRSQPWRPTSRSRRTGGRRSSCTTRSSAYAPSWQRTRRNPDGGRRVHSVHTLTLYKGSLLALKLRP